MIWDEQELQKERSWFAQFSVSKSASVGTMPSVSCSSRDDMEPFIERSGFPGILRDLRDWHETENSKAKGLARS